MDGWMDGDLYRLPDMTQLYSAAACAEQNSSFFSDSKMRGQWSLIPGSMQQTIVDLKFQQISSVAVAVFSSKNSLSKFHHSHITSNLLTHAWSIKCR